jgi:hypothetical protein
MEEPPNSEHQGLYSHRVGNRTALMPRGSKRRFEHQSSPGWKEISLDGEEMALLWKPGSSEKGRFGRGSTSVFYELAQGYS